MKIKKYAKSDGHYVDFEDMPDDWDTLSDAAKEAYLQVCATEALEYVDYGAVVVDETTDADYDEQAPTMNPCTACDSGNMRVIQDDSDDGANLWRGECVCGDIGPWKMSKDEAIEAWNEENPL